METNNPAQKARDTKLLKRTYAPADGIAAVVCMLLGYAYFKIMMMYSEDFKTYFPFFTAAYTAFVLIYGKVKGVKPTRETYIWVAVALMASFVYKITPFYRLLLATLRRAYFTRCRANALLQSETGGYAALDLANVFFNMPFGNFFSCFAAVRSLFKPTLEKREKTKIPVGVFWGILMTVFALSAILPLLFSADTNLAGVAERFTSGIFRFFFPRRVNFVNMMFTLIPSLLVAQYIFGLVYCAFSTGKFPAVTFDEAQMKRDKLRFSQALAFKILMRAVCAVYIIFALFQTNYLFGAFFGELYGDMTYSEYARTGFFQLFLVCGINLGIICLENLLVKREEKDILKPERIALCALSLILLATAAAKMIMYIRRYGLTSKRILSTTFMIWLALVVIFAAFREKKRINTVKLCAFSAVIIFSLVLSVDTDAASDAFNFAFGYNDREKAEISAETVYTPSSDSGETRVYADF